MTDRRHIIRQALVFLSAILVPGLIPRLQAQTDYGINLSLWRHVSTQPSEKEGSSLINIGLLTSMNRLSGAGANILGAVTHETSYGLQASGLFNVGPSFSGIGVAGFTNVRSGAMSGATVSGGFSIFGDRSAGLTVSGLGSITGDRYKGMLISGLVNVAGDRLDGVALAGLASVFTGSQSGLLISGLANVSTEASSGLQIAGLANVNVSDYSGVQVSALMNLADRQRGIQLSVLSNVSGTIQGAQIGILNYTENGRGLQLGLVNFHRKDFHGAQIGLANLNPSTRLEILAASGTREMLTTGLRFNNRTNYSIITLGMNDYRLPGMDLALGYRAGLLMPITTRHTLSVDLGFAHKDNLTRRKGRVNRAYELSARLGYEMPITGTLRAFVSGGYLYSGTYHGKEFRKGLFGEAGLIIRTQHI